MAICAALALSAACVSGISLYRGRLAVESRELASESTKLLEAGDRHGAIEAALSALPESSAFWERPLVPEARQALDRALEARPGNGSVWRTGYRIELDGPLEVLDYSLLFAKRDLTRLAKPSEIAVSDGGYFAVSDACGHVSTYDLLTGKKLADCSMPTDMREDVGENFAYNLTPTNNHLVVSNAGRKPGTACFDAKTGELEWSTTDIAFASFYTLPRSDTVIITQELPEKGYSAMIFDLTSREWSETVADTADVHDSPPWFSAAIVGKTGETSFSAFDDGLHALDLASGRETCVETRYATITSLDCLGGAAVVASVDDAIEEGRAHRYAIEAFDESLSRIWLHEGTLRNDALETGDFAISLLGFPVIRGINKAGISVSAGDEALVLDPSDGSVAFSDKGDHPVIGMDAIGTTALCIERSDGLIACREPLAQDDDDDARALTTLALPCPIRWADAAKAGEATVVLAVPADSDNSIIAYFTEFDSPAGSTEQRTLDEAVALAHSVLVEGGRE